MKRWQYHCSNSSGLCDRCGQEFGQHFSGDYYCPQNMLSICRERDNLEYRNARLRVALKKALALLRQYHLGDDSPLGQRTADFEDSIKSLIRGPNS